MQNIKIPTVLGTCSSNDIESNAILTTQDHGGPYLSVVSRQIRLILDKIKLLHKRQL